MGVRTIRVIEEQQMTRWFYRPSYTDDLDSMPDGAKIERGPMGELRSIYEITQQNQNTGTENEERTGNHGKRNEEG
jgi:hypothetical protein